MSAELTARRKFDEEVTKFLATFGLTEDFETWRKRQSEV